MGEAILFGSVIVILGLGISFALIGALRRAKAEVFFAFASFFFLLLGLRLMIGSVNDDAPLVGDFIASLALTFFWASRRKT